MLQDVAAALQLMDFLVLPSYREGFPNVVLEASAAGRPTIGFQSTEVVDSIVDGATGRLVPRGSVDDLAAAMQAYLADPATAEAHGAAALERVERLFAQERVFATVDGLYRDALESVVPLPSGTAG